MRVLVTGGMGLVGRSVVAELLAAGHSVRLFDTSTRGRARRLVTSAGIALRSVVRRALGDRSRLEFRHGDLCNIADIGEAVRDLDAVIHLGALIPPMADRNPTYANYVNLGGTENLIHALEATAPAARLVFTSSIAIYGDRRGTPEIHASDSPNPGASDHYAQQKLAAESVVRESTLDWVILRLTYIVSHEKLRTDPLMFHMPLNTDIEVCTAGDTARALVHALSSDAVLGRTLDIAGGPACRTTYREYLVEMMRRFGIEEPLPAAAFSSGPFHCGHVTTDESQALLDFQRETLSDYYQRVARAVRFKRGLMRAMPLVRRVVVNRLLATSEFAARRPEPRPVPTGVRVGRLLHRLIRTFLGMPRSE